MRKSIIAGVIVACIAVAAAEAGAASATGAEYLKLSKRQRVDMVKAYKDQAKKEGVTIKKEPIFYCKSLDAFYRKHPDMKKEPLANVLKTLIVMEYDWDQKGVDKEALARQALGDAAYQANKKRLGKK